MLGKCARGKHRVHEDEQGCCAPGSIVGRTYILYTFLYTRLLAAGLFSALTVHFLVVSYLLLTKLVQDFTFL
jgi:hypothetical protein